MSAPRIRVEIDELILHGFDPRQRYAIADALQLELTAALGDLHVPKSRSTPHVDAGSFTMQSGASAAAVGQAIARQVRSGLD